MRLLTVQGCAGISSPGWTHYTNTNGLPRVETVEDVYIVSEQDEPVRPVAYEEWFVPADWMIALEPRPGEANALELMP